jgi:hypothetical protein
MAYKRIAVSDRTLQRIKKIASERGVTMIALLDEFASNYECEDDGIDAIEMPEFSDDKKEMLRVAKQTSLRTTVSITMATMVRLTFLREWTGKSKAQLLEDITQKLVRAWVMGKLQIDT